MDAEHGGRTSTHEFFVSSGYEWSVRALGSRFTTDGCAVILVWITMHLSRIPCNVLRVSAV